MMKQYLFKRTPVLLQFPYCFRANRVRFVTLYHKEMAGSFGSMKKSKKGNDAKLPKQPQRGLGVAQLEKIRLQRQIAECVDPSMQSSFLDNSQKATYVESLPLSFNYGMPQATGFVRPPNIMMTYKCCEKPEARYEDCGHWSSTSSSSNHSNASPLRRAHDSITLPLFEQKLKDSENIYMRGQQHEWIHVIDLTTPNDEEIDLELRL